MAKDSLRKVVLRRKDGTTILGFTYSDVVGPEIRIINRQGKEEKFTTSDLKAIFFVHDFKGDPHYEPLQFLRKIEMSEMLWARLEFSDGEILEGKVANNAELLTAAGFVLYPSDPETNNQCVFVPKSAVRKFVILSVVH